MNALADQKVGDYLNEHFVSSFQKVGTFRIVNDEKQGGNVASYFLTPDRRVLHVVAGPANARTLLREARWVVEIYKAAQLEAPDDPDALRSIFRKAHADRLQKEHKLDVATIDEWHPQRALNLQGKVHLLMTAAPLVKLERAYKVVFENILGEKVSTDPVEDSSVAQ